MLSEILTYQELIIYLEKHTPVKTSLIKNLIDKCLAVCESDRQASEIILQHNFFGKYDQVIEVVGTKTFQPLQSKLIDVAIQQKDLETLEKFEQSDLLNESYIDNLFNSRLAFEDYQSMLNNCSFYSRLFAKTVDELKTIDLTNDEILILINNLNQILYGENSILLSLRHPDLNADLMLNTTALKENQSRSLRELRGKLQSQALRKIKRPSDLFYFIDLIQLDDLNNLQFELNTNKNLKRWVDFELSLRNVLKSKISFVSSLEASELTAYADFNELWINYSNSKSKSDIFLSFNLLKQYIIKVICNRLPDDLDYKLLLNNSLMAFYLKGLFELGLISDIPQMDEIFLWPTIHEVRAYVNRFEGDFHDQSPLGLMGYTVRMNLGLTQEDRQNILNRAFIDSDFNYVEYYDWGYKGTPNRLKCIASHLAMLIKNSKRQSRNMDQAIERWEEDLEYLRKEFYDNRCAAEFLWSDIQF